MSTMSTFLDARRRNDLAQDASWKPCGIQTIHQDNDGDCRVMLADIPVLASYTVERFGGLVETIEVVAVHIRGHEVPAEAFSADLLRQWATDIAIDRAADLRIAREAAEAEQ